MLSLNQALEQAQVDPQLVSVVDSITNTCKNIAERLRGGALSGLYGSAEQENIQGEVQKKLDVISNDLLKQSLLANRSVAGIASEEEENVIVGNAEGRYLVTFDPLDGSSNIDVNVTVGTIFSIYRRITPVGTPVQLEDFLQKGSEQVAAGYVVYGTSTMIVYTTGDGVNGFTLNPAIGTFYLSHPDIKFPEDGTIYSVNEGNYLDFPLGVKKYIKYCQEEFENRPYTSRYIGSLVSDFHRNMIKGGIYMYPKGSRNPNGKLRLLYECNPMAFIAEQANGKSSDGYIRTMDVTPIELHQRVPFFCGSKKMVTKLEDFMKKFGE